MDKIDPVGTSIPSEKAINKFLSKFKKVSSNFKTLPVGTKKLLSLGMVVALLVALPIVVMTVVTTRTFFFNRAATGETIEPPPTPIPLSNIVWKTNDASLVAKSLEIQIPNGTQNGITFRVNPSKMCNPNTGEYVCLNSSPPSFYNNLYHTTLEAKWYENDVEMRVNIYFLSDKIKWWSNEIRVYNGQPAPNSDWVYYYGKFFESYVGKPFLQTSQFVLDTRDPLTGGPISLRLLDFNIQAFRNYFPAPTMTSTPTPRTPTPSPRTPSPTPKTPTPRTPTPSPRTPSPTPRTPIPWTPYPTPNPSIKPVISTTSLPTGRVKKYYSASISGYEKVSNARLSMGISGLPKGLSTTCVTGNNIGGSMTTISCYIKGTPLSWGIYKIPVTLYDSRQQSVSKTFRLIIYPF